MPTTILAQQHFTTFSERMADYPVKIDVLSRFKTRKEQKETLEKTSAGLVDILIGTHGFSRKTSILKTLALSLLTRSSDLESNTRNASKIPTDGGRAHVNRHTDSQDTPHVTYGH